MLTRALFVLQRCYYTPTERYALIHRPWPYMLEANRKLDNEILHFITSQWLGLCGPHGGWDHHINIIFNTVIADNFKAFEILYQKSTIAVVLESIEHLTPSSVAWDLTKFTLLWNPRSYCPILFDFLSMVFNHMSVRFGVGGENERNMCVCTSLILNYLPKLCFCTVSK